MWPNKEDKPKVDYLKVKLIEPGSEPIIFEMDATNDEGTFDDDDEILWIETVDGRIWHFPLRGVQYYIYSKEKPR